ncbi:MAG: hypothetical protein WKF73_16660 [Nocardioidaceae bacterium]
MYSTPDRYGAFVDFGKYLTNRATPDEVVTAAANYMKANDPYGHPVSHSFVYAMTPQVHDIPALDFTSPHLYEVTYAGNEFTADTIIVNRILEDGKKTFNKPIQYGEWGNYGLNNDPLSSLRMRLTTWTAFFNEASLIFGIRRIQAILLISILDRKKEVIFRFIKVISGIFRRHSLLQ